LDGKQRIRPLFRWGKKKSTIATKNFDFEDSERCDYLCSMKSTKICVIGMGYVGLPLARLFSTQYPTIGFDVNPVRVEKIMSGHDDTLEVSDELLQAALKNGFRCTTNPEDLRDYNFYIVAVPTPIDVYNRPNLKALIDASTTVGKVIGKGDIVVYESTVYPGVTEEECLPVVEQVSGMKLNIDFFAGYSPERINPGDKGHTVETIQKVTSGSTPEAAEQIDTVYRSVLTEGTHKAPSIRVAEASKIIENAQRDVNIAFMNELAKIFNAMGIDTNDVIEAASTKWNFIRMPFLRTAVLQGFVSALIAIAVLGLGMYLLYTYDPEIAVVLDLNVMVVTAVIMLAFGILITFFCSWLSVNKFLRMKASSLYKI